MHFIDRLLQSRRIVTKVLLFVVPLVALIAGVGLLGYHTANMLNGHMTVTRATIENISDFENLQAALQEFVSDPTDQAKATLARSIDAQEAGVQRLNGLLTTGEQHSQLDAVSGLASTMRAQQDALWAVRQKEEQSAAAIASAMAASAAAVQEASKQTDLVRKDFSEKETFAKELLYDAAAFKALSGLMGGMRVDIQMGFSPEEQIDAAQKGLDGILKQIAVSAALASKDGIGLINAVEAPAKKLDALLKSGATPDEKASGMAPMLAEFVKIEGQMTLQSDKNSGIAADRFVTLDKTMDGQKELVCAPARRPTS